MEPGALLDSFPLSRKKDKPEKESSAAACKSSTIAATLWACIDERWMGPSIAPIDDAVNDKISDRVAW
jgi:hypothetical protein